MNGQNQTGCMRNGTPNTSLIQVSIQSVPGVRNKSSCRDVFLRFLTFSSFTRFVLARISWTLLHWLLSLADISELYYLAREFFNVFKILIILCHPIVKDVIYLMNCYPLLKWEWSASLVLRKWACLALKRDETTGQGQFGSHDFQTKNEERLHLLGEEYREISIYLQTPVNCWPSRLSPWINYKHSAWPNEPSVCIFNVLIRKEYMLLHLVSQAKVWSADLLGEQCSVLLSWIWCNQDLISLSWCASKYSGHKLNLC